LRRRGGRKQGQREKSNDRSLPRDGSVVRHLSIIGQLQSNP
jgi:hypothetical protein